jgi:MmyB-like transcription regulator ligand binding domain
MHHRLAGELTLDCDVLTVPGSDLKITVYTAAAGSPDAERLEFLKVSAVHTDTP